MFDDLTSNPFESLEEEAGTSSFSKAGRESERGDRDSENSNEANDGGSLLKPMEQEGSSKGNSDENSNSTHESTGTLSPGDELDLSLSGIDLPNKDTGNDTDKTNTQLEEELEDYDGVEDVISSNNISAEEGDELKTDGEGLLEVIGSEVEDTLSNTVETAEDIITQIETSGDNIQHEVEDITELLGSEVEDTLSNTVETAEDIITQIETSGDNIQHEVEDITELLGSEVEDTLSNTVETAEDISNAALEEVQSTVSKAFNDLSSIPDVKVEALKKLSDEFVDDIKSVIDLAQENTESLDLSVFESIQKIADTTKNAVEDIVQDVSDHGMNTIQHVADQLQNSLDANKGVVSDGISGLGDGLQELDETIETLQDTTQKAVEDIITVDPSQGDSLVEETVSLGQAAVEGASDAIGKGVGETKETLESKLDRAIKLEAKAELKDSDSVSVKATKKASDTDGEVSAEALDNSLSVDFPGVKVEADVDLGTLDLINGELTAATLEEVDKLANENFDSLKGELDKLIALEEAESDLIEEAIDVAEVAIEEGADLVDKGLGEVEEALEALSNQVESDDIGDVIENNRLEDRDGLESIGSGHEEAEGESNLVEETIDVAEVVVDEGLDLVNETANELEDVVEEIATLEIEAVVYEPLSDTNEGSQEELYTNEGDIFVAVEEDLKIEAVGLTVDTSVDLAEISPIEQDALDISEGLEKLIGGGEELAPAIHDEESILDTLNPEKDTGEITDNESGEDMPIDLISAEVSTPISESPTEVDAVHVLL